MQSRNTPADYVIDIADIVRERKNIARAVPRIPRVIQAGRLTGLGRMAGSLGRMAGGSYVGLAAASAGLAYGIGEHVYHDIIHKKADDKFKKEGYQEISATGVKTYVPSMQPLSEPTTESTRTHVVPHKHGAQQQGRIKYTTTPQSDPTIQSTQNEPPKIISTKTDEKPPPQNEPPKIISTKSNAKPPSLPPKQPKVPKVPKTTTPTTVTTPPTVTTVATASTEEPKKETDLLGRFETNRGLYMGNRPIVPIHFRVPKNRPYNLVDWERGARAKALSMIQ